MKNTDITVGTTAIKTVKRLGINLGTLTFYDSGQITQNLINRNPGFEGQIWNSIIRCAAGSSTTCVDDDLWSGWPAGFWDGATFEVFFGKAEGRTGRIVKSSATGKGSGITLNFSEPGVPLALGDHLIVRKTVPGGASTGWWQKLEGAGKIEDNLTDLPPNTSGKQTVALNALTARDSAALTAYFDTVPEKMFLKLNGTYQLQFKAKGISGSKQVDVMVRRNGVTAYLNQPTLLSDGWATYNLTFTADETSAAPGSIAVSFTAPGPDSLYLDDVSLMRISGDLKNTTGFRDPVVSALRTLEPGILRFWGGNGQLGDTLDNLLAPEFGRQRAEFSAWATRSEQISYGLHDFLRLCQVTGAEPWFVVPSTFTTEDASHLIDYLTGAVTVPYGAKRAALGQTAPWTEVFSTIHLEFGNEAWNSGFKGGSIEYAEPYGARAQTIFGVMRANPAYVPAKFDLVLGGQAAWPGRNSEIQKHCTNNDSFAIAPYTMGTVDSFDTPEALFGSTFAEPEAYVSPTGSAEGISPGVVYQNWKAVQSPSRKVPLSFYEINMGTLSGTIPQAILDDYTPSLGAGLTVVDTMLISMSRFGVTNQAFFALPQYRFPRPDHKTALLWGAVVDMGVTDRKRPQFLALQLANQAIGDGSSMLRTKQTGADPVWNQPLANTVKLSAAHYIQSYAFRHGSGRSLIVFNFSLTASLPITFSDVNAPSGTVEVQRLTSAKPSDTNEKENLVQIQAFTLHDYSPSSVLSLPPFSMTVLKWNSDTSNFERSRRQ